MVNKIWITLLLSAFISCVNAQKYTKNEYGITCETSALKIDVQFFGSKTVRIVKSPAGHTFTKKSLSVVKAPQAVKFSVTQNGDVVTLGTSDVTVRVNLTSAAISFKTHSGNILLREQQSGTSFTPFDDAGNKTYTVYQGFALDADEAIYGLGQQQQGRMIQRDLTLDMVQGNTNDYIPFFQSVKGYGLFWDNYSPTQFNDHNGITSFKSDVGDCDDYYFMYGGNADGVIACMRDLTGQVPMFPLWTYGFWQSKERYKSQEELLEVVRKYRALNVPLDGIIQDWQYWGNNYLWNAMDFLNAEFPDPKKMVTDVHAMNAHMIISIWNSFGPETKQYKELKKMNALFDFVTWPESGADKWPPNLDYPSGVKVYDPYNPAARDLYWKYLKNLWSLNIDGWWMDSSEPDHLHFKPSDLDNKTYLGSFRKVRNAFPLMTVGGVYDHQRAVDSARRVFILTRSAFAGQQRYGANTWSGDVISTWEVLRNQISAGLNFSLTGIPYWNSDIGGFFLWRYPRKLEDPEYRELYVRWLEFGTFCPMMRSHGADAPREIYQFGQRGDRRYDAIEKYINLRYSLLPYIYSTSWQVSKNQYSMMRALMMDFPSDKNALNINDQFMFGGSFLVSPVTTPMYVKPAIQGRDTVKVEDFTAVKSRETYLPAGAEWYDFWSGEKMKGGTKVSRQTPLDIIPLYVKAGAVIPVGPRVQYAEQHKWDTLDVRIYAGANGKFVLYEDENDNYAYEKGVYATIPFSWDDAKRTLTIGARSGSFPGMLEGRVFNIVVVTPDKGTGAVSAAKPDRVVRYGGKKLSVKL